MKIDTEKLMGPDWHTEKETVMSSKNLIKRGCILALCLMAFGTFTIYQSLFMKDSVSADALYEESETNPSFIIQQVSDIEVPAVYKDDIPTKDTLTVLSKEPGTWHTTIEDGMPVTNTETVKLYADYKTDWKTTQSLSEMSFVNGYDLKEIWFGSNKDSYERSDFLILTMPYIDGKVDVSKVIFTNNKEHPGLSKAENGSYVPDETGCYTICILNNDVIRLIFEATESWESNSIDVFDYDVSDGGYYKGSNYDIKGNLQTTSGQTKETDPLYVNTGFNGIHAEYSGTGAKLAFGGSSIGTGLGDESLSNPLDTINIWNYGQQGQTFNTGVSFGLTKGIASDGTLLWNDQLSVPNLFGSGEVKGRTNYTNNEYTMTFKRNGCVRTLSSVESSYGTAAENLENISENFWILDVAPSYATDGHDIAWGDGENKTKYYNGTGSETFEPSDDKEKHNHFFGFSYTEDFILSAGYTGPLNFFGYSDDDLWAYAAQIDKNGKVMENTVIPVADLGGVHDGAAYYTNLWNHIDKIKYGEEEEHWRLFLFWLERDGSSANCYLRFSFPEASVRTTHDTSSVMVEAVDSDTDENIGRTFVFDDGTYNKYPAMIDKKSEITVTSGEVFTIPTGSILTINDLPKEREFTITETEKARVWASKEEDYKEMDTLSGKAGVDKWFHFLSMKHIGTLTIGVNANETPEGGYVFDLKFAGLKDMTLMALDASGNPQGYLPVDSSGSVPLTLSAGDTIYVCDIPEDMEFTLTPQTIDERPIKEIFIDEDLKVSGSIVTGPINSQVIYSYE